MVCADPMASEIVNVMLTGYSATSLSDNQGNNIPIGTFTGGQINITGTTVVPEPSAFILLLTTMPSCAAN